MKTPPNTCWCASCRKTYPDLLAARGCPCEHPIPALRGEYSLTMAQLEGARPKPCSCGAPIVWVRSSTGAKLPLARSRARLVECATCTGPRCAGPAGEDLGRLTGFSGCVACRGRGRHYLVPSHHIDCPNAARHRGKKEPSP